MLFDFEWKRCPDGYDIIKRDGDSFVASRSSRIEAYKPWEVGVERGVAFMAFAKSPKSKAAILKLADAYGLLHFDKASTVVGKWAGAIEVLGEWQAAIGGLKTAVRAWEAGKTEQVKKIANDLGILAETNVSLIDDPSNPDGLALRLQPRDLYSALWFQFAESAAAGSKIRRCAFPTCGKPFAYGTGTGRRETAQYCSPKCRKAHEYARRKGMDR